MIEYDGYIIYVYLTVGGMFRAYVKGSAHIQAWAYSQSLALQRVKDMIDQKSSLEVLNDPNRL